MLFFRKKIRNTHIVTGAALVALALLASTCEFVNNEGNLSGVVHPSGEEFAGSETCLECHKAIADSHALTPHFMTSRPGDTTSVLGSFDSTKNIFVLNDRLKVVMERTEDGLFQRAFVGGKEVDSKRMDITLGSGRQGQTYLYWKDDVLFQLPVSFHAPSKTWSNSPGYPTDQILFNRSISARCLECHSTYFKPGRLSQGNETFDRDQVMLGVDCERCHGPAGRHVMFHQKNPKEEKAKYIVNPAELTRKQRLDNCALCHSGIRNNILPSFSFMVGDNLDDFSFPSQPADSGATLDVHGNQYGLLTSSKCFKMSEMDCSSCHNVHVRETGKLEIFSARCMNCHQEGSSNFCKQEEVHGLVLNKNSIDCHMPALPSRQVFLRSADNKSTPFFVRTHLVGSYKKQIKMFLEKIEMAKGEVK